MSKDNGRYVERRSGRARLHLVTPAAAPESDDVELVRAFVNGEDWAGRAIWTRHAPMVHRLLARALGPSADAEDLTQDVFLSTFQRLPTLRHPAALRSFIYSIALRTLQWELRRRRIRRILQLSPNGQPPELPVQAFDGEARQILKRFYLLLDRLGANERLAFVLRHMEGFKLQEIGEHMGVSLATVKRWLSSGSQRVSALVDADDEFASYFRERGVERGAFSVRG